MDHTVYLSIVIPVYNEERNLPELYERLVEVLAQVKESPVEILFVDDGSMDSSYNLLKDFKERDERVKIVQLAHNYGQQAALMAGFAHAKGEVVITLDADLQNDPLDIPKFLAEINNGHDAVYGWRDERKDPIFTRKVPSYLANLLISRYSGKRLHDYGCNFKAFNRQIVDYILETGETGKAPAVLGAKGASNIKEISIGHAKRMYGESRYSFNMLMALAMDIITGYSTRPFQAVGILGILTFIAGMALSFYYIISRFILHSEFEPKVFVLTILLPFMGLQFMTLGFLGEFIIRIYNVTLKKPMYKVKRYLG